MSTEMTSMQEMVDMAKALQQSAQGAAEDSAAFLKFTKFGNWIFGTEDNEVEDDSLWVVHPTQFRHGYIAWGDTAHGNQGEKLGEIMQPATQPLPPMSSLDEVKGAWSQQISMQLLCIEGMDKGTKVLFNANSVGGRKAYQKIVNAVVSRIASGTTEVAPVVVLSKDSYTHKKFGLIYTPVINIEEYRELSDVDSLAVLDDDGEESPAIEEKLEEKAPEVKKEEAPRTRRARRSR
jgi:hypothetical protein